MTRQIKFRLWDKKKKEWLLGYELPSLGGFSMFGEVMMMGEYASLLSSYFPDRLADIELMQFTGLLDKNGKEIYEGDIVKGRKIGSVEWSETEAMYLVSPADGYPSATLSNEHTGIEIIGNIYENSELLK